MLESEFRDLLEQIKNGTFIDPKLNLSSNSLDEEHLEEPLRDEQAILLTDALKQNRCITNINLSGNRIGELGAIALASVNTLEELDLNENPIGFKGVIALAGSNLKKLVLGTLHEEKEKTQELFLEAVNAFIANKTITNLHMGYYYLPGKIVAELISKNTTIKTLTLAEGATDETLEFIKNNTTLEVLHLPKNKITDVGAAYIAQNTSLKKIQIDESKITDIGAKILSTHLTLRKLVIRDSDITIKGAQVFADSKLEEFTISTGLKQNIISRYECAVINQTFGDSRNPHAELEGRPAKKLKMTYEDSLYIEMQIHNDPDQDDFLAGCILSHFAHED